MATFTYPGVYIEEVPSGQHNITGVATSIAAFIGWTNQGPVGQAVMVESWAEYQATFGGMIPGNYLGYAVYQFFLNGGSQAYIIRLVETATVAAPTPPATTPPATTAAAPAGSTIGGLVLTASNPGAWGNNIFIAVSNVSGNTFNLQVTMVNGAQVQVLESYTNLSTVATNANYAMTVVNNDSNYIRISSIGTPANTMGLSVPGTITSSGKKFLPGETITQANSKASSTVIGTVGSSGPLQLGVVTLSGVNPVTATDTWTGTTSSAVFTPTGASAPATAISVSQGLSAGASSASGDDGTVLIPGDPTSGADFLAQLQSTASNTVVSGYQLLSSVPAFNLLCVPGLCDEGAIAAMQLFCATNRAFLIVDSPNYGNLNAAMTAMASGPVDSTGATLVDSSAINSAFYFPWVTAPDPAVGFRPANFPPCGFVAGIYAATDASRGVWKAPAGINAGLTGALGLQYVLTDLQNGSLNTVGINCLRQFPIYGNVVWGARTVAGSDAAGSQWEYIPIRRLALFIESSLYQGTQWAVFEPNAEPLWGQVRLSIGNFMQGLFLQGAFAGTTPQQAYFVKCDADNNPDPSIAQGILNITVGFAPLYPAEFVVIQIQQMMSSS